MTASKPGIYIHIPFCLQKCYYCAFLSFPAGEREREEYTEDLIRELGMRTGEIEEADTVYFGGGTPSLLKPEQIGRILTEVYRNYRIAEDAEITLEANPATLSADRLRDYRSLGINRLSVGVQSMNDQRLRRLGRLHSREDVERETEFAREAGFDNISMDLIFSAPGTTVQDARDDLKDVLALKPEHLSLYSFQLEEGTRFFREFEEGRLQEVSDEEDREAFHECCAMLAQAGFEHYEISNFCLPGYWSRHNSKYWSMAPYLGAGLGASSYTKDRRIANTSDRDEYRTGLRSGRLPFSEIHPNSYHDTVSETVWTGLRRREGVRFEEVFDSREDFEEYYRDVWDEVLGFAARGMLELDGTSIRLTEQGVDISNKIMALFV